MQSFFEVGAYFQESLDILPFFDVPLFGVLAFALHDSFGEVHILFFDFELSEVGCDVFALGRRSFSWGLTGEEMMITAGHDHFDGLRVLSGSHFVLEAFHRDWVLKN
jgi:hypothetical protein